jgi:phage terminase small subunit
LPKVITNKIWRSEYAYKPVTGMLSMDSSELTTDPTVSFGSKKAIKGSMGHAEESPGHLDQKITKGVASKDKDNPTGGLAILPPISKAKIKTTELKGKGDV